MWRVCPGRAAGRKVEGPMLFQGQTKMDHFLRTYEAYWGSPHMAYTVGLAEKTVSCSLLLAREDPGIPE